MAKLILVLGDQLSHELSSLRNLKPDDVVVMMEVRSETDKIHHHRRKIVFLFSAMRHFEVSLRKKCKTEYIKLTDRKNEHDFIKNLDWLTKKHHPDEIVMTEPSEYHLLQFFEQSLPDLGVPYSILNDDRFFISKEEFTEFAQSSKNLLMENFYRWMRKKTGYLMEGAKPKGGKWNFDHSNRSKYDGKTPFPIRKEHKPDAVTKEVIELVQDFFPSRFGSVENFSTAVSREQALEDLEFFANSCLMHFGKYQDAMISEEAFGFHSRLSHLINCGLLSPKEVCERILEEIDNAPIESIEGFIRQIIGWREYIRGVYWLNMPNYLNENFFGSTRHLPEFYWTGKCKMNCLSKVISSTEKHAYSHHIQRLMITGNFAMLCGIDPNEVHEWYLAVYDDAYEWVELPNTYGMALYADGGKMSTKPYAAGGNYINKMSDFCKSCHYKVSQKTGSDACPFNYLYWYFLDKNKDVLENNRRLFMPYRTLSTKSEDDLIEIRKNAESFLNSL